MSLVTSIIPSADDMAVEPWFWRLVEAGDTRAMVCVGDSLSVHDVREAYRWYRRAADLGEALAMIRLAALSFPPGDSQRARWYLAAAEAGHLGAMWTLATQSVDRDEVLRWTRAAAERGHGGAAERLGTYLDEQGQAQEAATWYRRAIEAGDVSPKVYVSLGRVLAELGELEEAQRCLEAPASLGVREALDLLLEVLVRRGEQPVEWRTRLPLEVVWSIARSARQHGEDEEVWLQAAAERGHAAAAERLGEILLERGLAEDAERWCRQAAEAGRPDAATDLGRVLVLLERVEEAKQWLSESAETGSKEALALLVEVLEHRGEHAKAEAWLTQAKADRRRRAEDGGPTGSIGDDLPGVPVIVATAVVAVAVAPFVKTLAAKAAEDTYAAVQAWLARLFAAHHRDQDRSPMRNQLLVVEDPDRQLKLALHLWMDTPDEAIRALGDLDMDMVARASKRKGVDKVRIYWDQSKRSWRILED